ncbi:MAG: glycoside hydrolase family 3 C-terminal domain-containing protein [Bacteroidales bacterium]|nr:glycoside hydrolase family 3 C-terminal domain-containing protein [Bacteroidales bacterium]
MYMKRLIVSILLMLTGAAGAYAQYVISAEDRARAASIVEKMTLQEKCALITGQDDGFHTAAVQHLGIPSVRMADGPQGVRNKTTSTYYPCGISLAASFNRDVAHGVGTGIGWDASARGVRIMLCPGVNIYRSPLCGRNFEYYGEDPYLASETALQYINGIQEQRVIATIKHFALNNQEYDRHWTASYADERTMNEIYFPTFRKAVEQGHVGAVMTSYNPVNGEHAAENARLIGNLRCWGHEGIVMSDWTSTYTTLGCLTGGLDLEMPKGYVLNFEAVNDLVANGQVDESVIDDKCVHILSAFIAFGLLEKPMLDSSIPENNPPSREKAYAAALEGPVLLKNDGILPVKASKKNRIVVLGPNADIIPYGGGSGKMHPIVGTTTTLYQGLAGLGNKYSTTLMDWQNIDEAVLAKASLVVLGVGFNFDTEGEGFDRTYSLPAGQNELIARVASINPNVLVVANSGGEFDITPWIGKVKGLLMAWYGGQESGKAIAAIITGAASPSGRLPFTFWGSEEANPAAKYYHASVPDVKKQKKNRDPLPHSFYKEGIFVGYRGVEKFGCQPMFPFGFGLSYSSFDYAGGAVEMVPEGVKVCFSVKNNGAVPASVVPQVYVEPVNPCVPRPHHELKGYDKVKLGKGESADICIILPSDAFCRYDATVHKWVKDSGEYNILVGDSSSDIRLSMKVML